MWSSYSRSTKNLIYSLVLLVGLACTLIACGNDPLAPDTTSSGYFHVTDVNVKGQMVPCITWKLANAGGLSCDWTRAR